MMGMTVRGWMAGLAVGGALALAPVAMADGYRGFGHRGHRGHHGPPVGTMIDHHAEALGLDEETREAVREIVEASHEEGEALRREAEAARGALHELMEQEPVDRDAVLDQVERVGDLRTESKKHRIETLLDIRELLTPEQRATLKDTMSEMHRSFRGGRLGALRDACEAEREQCPGHGPRMLHCLHRQGAALSEPCAAALDALPLPRRHGPDGPPWRSAP